MNNIDHDQGEKSAQQYADRCKEMTQSNTLTPVDHAMTFVRSTRKYGFLVVNTFAASSTSIEEQGERHETALYWAARLLLSLMSVEGVDVKRVPRTSLLWQHAENLVEASRDLDSEYLRDNFNENTKVAPALTGALFPD
jgi:hypothetical protein